MGQFEPPLKYLGEILLSNFISMLFLFSSDFTSNSQFYSKLVILKFTWSQIKYKNQYEQNQQKNENALGQF